jgi:hypothetical protein
MGKGCVFDHEAWTCRHQGEATPCRLYKRADECATAGHCVFDTRYRACHEATGAVPCEAARSAADCAELGQAGAQTCVWSAHLAQCSAAPDGEALCSRMEIEPACVDTKGCAWHGAAGICRRADDASAVPCWQYRFADGCNAAPGCWFDEQVLFCRAKGEQRSCLQLHDPVHCMAEPHCEWSRKANMCVRTGQPIECFMITREQECQSLGCEYYGLLCHAKGSRVPCDQCTDAPMCYANGCLWNPAAKRPCAPLTALQTEMRALTNHPGAPPLDCTHFPCSNVPTQCPAGQVLQRPVRRCCAECAPDMAACLSIDTETACTKARLYQRKEK